MAKNNSRARDKTVTSFISLLVPAVGEEPKHGPPGTLMRAQGPAGSVVWDEDGQTLIQPVKRFRLTDEHAPARFSAVSNLMRLHTGKKIDASILNHSCCTLFQDLGQPFANAISKAALKDPRKIAARWLLPIFNKEIRAARLVMYCPRKSFPRPAIYCPDEVTALFVRLLFSGISACLGCGMPFTPDRPNQIYHDLRCANRHRKRRERRRKG